MAKCKCFQNIRDQIKKNQKIAAVSNICLKKELAKGNLADMVKAERHFRRKEDALLDLRENFINLKRRVIILERLSKYSKKRAERYIEEFGEDHRFVEILQDRSETLKNMAEFFRNGDEKTYSVSEDKDD